MNLKYVDTSMMLRRRLRYQAMQRRAERRQLICEVAKSAIFFGVLAVAIFVGLGL